MMKNSSLNHNKTHWNFVSIVSICSCLALVALDCCLHYFVVENIPSLCLLRISFLKIEGYLASSTNHVKHLNLVSWDFERKVLNCISLTNGSLFYHCSVDRICKRPPQISWKDCTVSYGLYYYSFDNAMTFLYWHSMMWWQRSHNIWNLRNKQNFPIEYVIRSSQENRAESRELIFKWE